MGAHGASLLPTTGGVLTHCNAGALATGGYGTALGVIRAPSSRATRSTSSPTRPAPSCRARASPPGSSCTTASRPPSSATTWPPASCAGQDPAPSSSAPTASPPTATSPTRSAPTASPFWPASTASRSTSPRPWSTIDLATATGADIPIEERAADEVTHLAGKQLTPTRRRRRKPGLRRHPGPLVTAIITERGVLRAPYSESLRLARISNRPAAVWLHQIDITAGDLWDVAVQRALLACPRMVVILSPVSVASPNVLDEISFALRKRKTIVPVLYRDCEMPFRLDRIQYLDFRTDYSRGFKALLGILSAEQNISLPSSESDRREPARVASSEQMHQPLSRPPVSAPVDERRPKESAASSRPEPANRDQPKSSVFPRISRSAQAAIGASVLVVAALIWYGVVRSRASSGGPPLRAVTFSNSQSGWAVGEAGILHTEDGGNTWSISRKPPPNESNWSLRSVAFPTSESGWVVGSRGEILHTTDGGRTWDGVTVGIYQNLNCVVFITPQSGWIVGDLGTILNTNDGGQTWSTQVSGTQEVLLSVAFPTPKLGWAVGLGGTILHTSDGGAKWTPYSRSVGTWLRSISFTTPQSGWIVGDHVIMHTEDGNTWRGQNSASDNDLYSVVFTTALSGSAARQWRYSAHKRWRSHLDQANECFFPESVFGDHSFAELGLGGGLERRYSPHSGWWRPLEGPGTAALEQSLRPGRHCSQPAYG